MTPTLRELGFAMPAEWTPHDAVWTAWPHDEDLWVGMLEPVRQDFAMLVRALARSERVELIVNDEAAELDARARLGSANVRCHRVAHDDVWLRDSGPIFVSRSGTLAAVGWEFNGWGRKYEAALDNELSRAVAARAGMALVEQDIVLEGGSIEVNGAGVVLTTRQCLLSPERNPQLSEADIERYLRDSLGVEKVLWLDEGLDGDHTDGHIDTIARFADERTIVTCVCEDRADPNHRVLVENLERLRSFSDASGRSFRIVELPLPAVRMTFEGQRLPPTYANFYISNDAVIVPVYGDPNDARALDVLRPLFPGREVLGLEARGLITGGGAFHCVTQQQPAGVPWDGR